MGDAEAIGVIIDDVIDVLYDLYKQDEQYCYIYVINVLKYINLLCEEQFIDLDMVHKLDKESVKLIELHRKCV